MAQKILKVGSSAAVTIPKEVLKELGLKIGDQVQVEKKKRGVLITPVSSIEVDEELVRWTDKFIDEYRPALEALAKK